MRNNCFIYVRWTTHAGILGQKISVFKIANNTDMYMSYGWVGGRFVNLYNTENVIS